MTELGDAALAYARRGLLVFPARGKVPLTTNGHLDATADWSQIERWWSRWPHANVAVRTGEPSRLVTLDVDGEEGADSLSELEHEHGLLPCTTSVATPRGGEHYHFRWPGVRIKTTNGVIAPGLDVKGDGGYVLMPPSRTSHGVYEWDEHSRPAPMPQWLVERTSAEVCAPAKATSPDLWVAMIRDGIPEGERNAALTRLTGHLLRRWLDEYLVEALVHLVNERRCRPPLPLGDVDRILDSVARHELRRREGNGR
jgi:hypothetical protein